jgi:hypothetical protein
MDKFNLAEMPSMGVKSIEMLYISALVASLGFAIQFLFSSVFGNFINHKKINYIYAFSLITVVFSLMTSTSSPGIGYRIGFLLYVWSPLLISLMLAIGILLLAGLHKKTHKRTPCFQ